METERAIARAVACALRGHERKRICLDVDLATAKWFEWRGCTSVNSDEGLHYDNWCRNCDEIFCADCGATYTGARH